MLGNQRDFFNVPENVTYLNCASYSPLMNRVYEAGIEGLGRKYCPWGMDLSKTPAEVEQARELFASLIGAKGDDIAIIGSTSYGVATAAQNIEIKSGQKIVILQDQFPSNVYSWRKLAQTRNGVLSVIPRPSNDDWTTAVLESLNKSVAIAALPPCHWSDGSCLDLGAIGVRCRELGITLVVDGTQAIGAIPFDIREIQPDFVACSAYKWLFCPYSLAFLYVAPHRQEGIPLEDHRWNHASPQVSAVETVYPEIYNTGARRYDIGEINNLINMPMAVKALEQIKCWKPASIQEYLTPLTDAVAEGAKHRGWRVPSADHRVGHFIGIRPETELSQDIVMRLQRDHNVFVSHRGGAIRISPHVYNDAKDIHNFFQALDEVFNCSYLDIRNQ